MTINNQIHISGSSTAKGTGNKDKSHPSTSKQEHN